MGYSLYKIGLTRPPLSHQRIARNIVINYYNRNGFGDYEAFQDGMADPDDPDSHVRAQEKYEFMIIQYRNLQLSISIDGVDYKYEEPDFTGQKRTTFNANPLLNKVKEYQEKNWEVINFETVFDNLGAQATFVYLRKKRTETK